MNPILIVAYFYRDSRNAVFFLALYPKNQKTDLSTEDRKALKARIRTIKEEAYP